MLLRTFIFLCVSVGSVVVSAQKLNKQAIQFIKIKNQTTNLVILNQRTDALNILNKELKSAEGDYKNKLTDLKYNILNQFLSLPAQEAFETAAASLLNNRKKALSQIQQCLAFEPQNLQCEWLELKYMKRYSPDGFAEKANLYIDKIKDFRQSQLLKYTLYIALDRVSEVPSNIKIKALQPEDEFLLHIINYQLAIKTQDQPRAKAAVEYFNVNAHDYPDLIFMIYQMSLLWPDKDSIFFNNLQTQNETYKKKCADLPAQIARKFLYDISLCNRSIN